jgi:hypothetical protein
MGREKHKKLKKECCEKYKRKGKCCKDCPYYDKCPILAENIGHGVK